MRDNNLYEENGMVICKWIKMYCYDWVIICLLIYL